jgi:bifunctional non-homologous end joining protein LigD
MSGARVEIETGGRALRVSSLDKVLWPATGFTKRDLLAYYESAAPALLPHLAGRPVTLARFPDGVEGRGWYQTNCPPGRPDWLRVARVPAATTAEDLHYCVIDEPAALVWAANMGSLELHPFLASASQPGAPLEMVFDLDPGAPAGLLACCVVAAGLRAQLDAAGLRAFAKTSGAKGLHVVVPLDGGGTFAQTKAFARQLARRLVEERPDLVTDRMPRAERAGKVFIDWGQNDPNKSTIAPWSLRATRLPGVSMPLSWAEIEEAIASGTASMLRFGPADALARLARAPSPCCAPPRQRLPTLAA